MLLLKAWGVRFETAHLAFVVKARSILESMSIFHEIVEGIKDKEGPNFLVVLLWAGAALAAGLITAVVLLSVVGLHLIPQS